MSEDISPEPDANGSLVPPPAEPPASSGAADDSQRPDPHRHSLSEMPIAKTVRDLGDRLMNAMDEAAEAIRSAAGIK